MFKIIEGDFKNNKYSDEEYLDNWPMLYILENGRQAYIGESSHVKTRMTQHSSIEEKRIFDKVHFIYSKLFNQSVTFDYESKLIQYIAADELYEVTKKNNRERNNASADITRRSVKRKLYMKKNLA